MEERVNIKKCMYLLDTYTLRDFTLDFNGSKKDAKFEFDKLQKYLKHKVSDTDRYVKYNYIHGRSLRKNVWGHRQCSDS